MANWRRITGAAGLVVGAAAAGVGAVVAAERIAVNRIRGRADSSDEPFGSLRCLKLTVRAEDGVPPHVEINGPDPAAPQPTGPGGAEHGAHHLGAEQIRVLIGEGHDGHPAHGVAH